MVLSKKPVGLTLVVGGGDVVGLEVGRGDRVGPLLIVGEVVTSQGHGAGFQAVGRDGDDGDDQG